MFFQRTEFCRESEVNVKLGITQDFYAYEWQRNGQTIATRTGTTDNIVNGASIISYTGNDITVKLYGTYRVRFQRRAGGGWSEWSPKPAEIKSKSGTQVEPIEIDGKRSKVLTALDGSTTVPLTMPDGFKNYKWYRANDDVEVAAGQKFDAPIGLYKGTYEEEFGCSTGYSPDFKVVDANGDPKPGAPSNLLATPVSETENKLTWTDASDETGLEIYRGETPGGPYTFIDILAANKVTFNDKGLAKNKIYYYVVRAVNETGASAGSNEATVKTLVDNKPPTAPSALKYTPNTATSVKLTWTASTDDKGVERYEIYVNGQKLYTSTTTTITVINLNDTIPYNFVVRAVDSTGNVSPASNQVTYIPNDVTPGEVPGSPTNVAATADTYNIITITWSDSTAIETGYEVVRSTTENGTYVPVGTVNQNTTSFVDSGLAASKTYYYKVRAINQNGGSAFSGKVSATTAALPQTPISPSPLIGQSEGAGISLAWTDNSANETKYIIYRSTDNQTFTAIDSLPANNNAYTDRNVIAMTNYYYYVAGSNTSGVGEKSNTVVIRAGNNAPAIGSIADIFVKSGASATRDFTVTDDPGDILTVKLSNNPAFATLTRISNTSYRLVVTSPRAEDVGTYNVTVTATDNSGKSSTTTFLIAVGDKSVRSVYINFGSQDKTAAKPWNNWLGARAAGDVASNLTDESGAATTVSVTTVNGWSALNDMGHITGDNSGVFPDAVLASGLGDSLAEAKQIKISGLNSAKQYNLVIAGSKNEGVGASASYDVSGQIVELNARYNTDQTANLNNLVPDANGEILMTITRTGNAPFTFLNGLVIEELDPAITLLGPNNIYAAALDRTDVKLTWSDRTNNEAATDGYEIQRATDSTFTKNIENITVGANVTAYTNTALTPDTKYWYRVRAKNGTSYSDYTKGVKVTTPETIVSVNFNVSDPKAPAPWNNLSSSPIFLFETGPLKDQSNKVTKMTLDLLTEFNGENISGQTTGDNSGIVPDAVLKNVYWLDAEQVSTFKLNGLNFAKRYRIGFVGSMGPLLWVKGDDRVTYTVNGRTRYLNSWMNTTKMVYLDDLEPRVDGSLQLDFSTIPGASHGFVAGIVIEEYTYSPETPPQDTTTKPPVDTTIINPPNPPDPGDTTGNNPPTNPGDTTGNNPPTNPGDTTGNNPPTNPGDTTGNNPPTNPGDTLQPYAKVSVFPNPMQNSFKINFFNKLATDKISIEITDPQGRTTFRRDYGSRPPGSTTLEVNGFQTGMRAGLYFVVLKINGERRQSVKIIKTGY